MKSSSKYVEEIRNNEKKEKKNTKDTSNFYFCEHKFNTYFLK